MVRVKVPATTANIGAGFDCMGLAFKLYNEYFFEEIPEGLEFVGVKEEFCNEQNIIYEAMIRCFNKANYKKIGVKIGIIKEEIPISRGLGSSSSCIVAGLIGANILMGSPFNNDDLFDLAVEIEGHPDNVAPAFFGGIVVSSMEEGKAYYNRIDIKDGIEFLAFIPEFTLSTEKARKALPEVIPFKDGVYNIGKAALTLSCFYSGNFDLLKVACKDKLHESYRSDLIPNFENITDKARELGALCVFLSGAGPTIMCIIKKGSIDIKEGIKKYLETLDGGWKLLELEKNNIGPEIVEG
ncbi:homoserine kinase [Clostridium sp. 'White wine YQ']|uniref:homoserine kinase n=1 Tax=Clostridium sp. 'White wine YQ' TaxID=3027474 RepID=UPI00236512ED|nr:homoserine kinase [Clostridium sp. 'White wine YQ']MDD7792951.1 homoserine kinase [Clostridium sp. 'White wine YQ']